MTQPSAMRGHHTDPPWPTRTTTAPLHALPRRPAASPARATTAACATGRAHARGARGRRRAAEAPGRRRRRPAPRISVWRVLRWLAPRSSAGWLLSLVLFLVSAQIQSSKVSERRRQRARRRRLPADLAEHDPRARLRRPRRRAPRRPGANTIGQPVALGLDPAAAHRRRRQRDALDPARHRRRHPRPRPEQDQRRLRVRRPGAGDQDRRAVPRHRHQPPGRGQLRELPAADRRARRHHLHGRLRGLASINGGSRTAATRCGCKGGTHEINGKQALALARTRKNDCNPKENDLTRARRQQKILAAIKDKVTSFETFVRLPVGLLGGAEGDPLRHGRPVAARPGRRRARPAAPRSSVLKPSGTSRCPTAAPA